MKEFLKKHYVKIIVLLVIAVFAYLTMQQENTVVPFELGQPVAEEPVTTYIYVDIKGEVQYPGVYKVEKDTRLFQVVTLAGGFTIAADKLAINLSRIIRDQEVIYIPNVAEEYPLITDVIEQNQNGIININTASLLDLQTLVGIGPSTAQSIIDYRTEHGDFQTIEDIMNVSGIGEATFENIKDFIIV